MFTKKGKESSCTTVKSNCAYAISEIKEVIKEYERINEKGTI
jgi:hypothetical protein